jgi:catechol 2,3-dioxygenase-like lactoylglutathione lyase family enzyme
MITKVGTVSLFVADQERARAFYTEKLGMELRTDAPLYPGAAERWIAVAPAGAETEIVLYLPDENWSHYKQVVGNSQALTLQVDDLQTTYNELSGKGVTFTQEPETQPWGTYAVLEDSEGNQLLLVEQPQG